jgi:hypothetical protein
MLRTILQIFVGIPVVVRFVLVILGGLTIGSAVNGAEMTGVGSQTCAKFASDYRSSPEFTENLYFTWAQGYLGGLNMGIRIMGVRMTDAKAKEKNGRDLMGLTLDAQMAFLRDYCNQHPLAAYYQAVVQLFSQLPWKHGDP